MKHNNFGAVIEEVSVEHVGAVRGAERGARGGCARRRRCGGGAHCAGQARRTQRQARQRRGRPLARTRRGGETPRAQEQGTHLF